MSINRLGKKLKLQAALKSAVAVLETETDQAATTLQKAEGLQEIGKRSAMTFKNLATLSATNMILQMLTGQPA